MARQGGLVLAVALTLMLVACFLSTDAQRAPVKKRPKAPRPPKRRVAVIVKDLEKNVSALWGKVDMLSQPVHVHVHGDSHLMDHDHHHDHHDHHHDHHDDGDDKHDHHGHGYHVHDHHDHRDHDHLPCDPKDPSSEKEGKDDKSAGVKKSGKIHHRPPPMMMDASKGRSGPRKKYHRKPGDDVSIDDVSQHGQQRHRLREKDGGGGDGDDDEHKHGHSHGKHGHGEPGHKKHDHHKHHPGGHDMHHHGDDHHCQHGHGHHHDHHDHHHHHHEDDDEDEEEDMHHHEGPGTHVHIHLHAGGMGDMKPHHQHQHQHQHQDVPPPPAKEYRYACCDLHPGIPAPKAKGTVMFRQMPGEPLEVQVKLSGFPIDEAKDESVRYLRGMHGHDFGDVRDRCLRQGGHYNPHGVNHGGRDAKIRHPGDFGNVVLNKDGTLKTSFTDTRASLFGDFSLLGRGLLFHEREDDLGLKDTAASKRSGDAGRRAACCSILACDPPKGVWPSPAP